MPTRQRIAATLLPLVAKAAAVFFFVHFVLLTQLQADRKADILEQQQRGAQSTLVIDGWENAKHTHVMGSLLTCLGMAYTCSPVVCQARGGEHSIPVVSAAPRFVPFHV